MKIEINITNKEFKDMITEKLAEKMWEESRRRTFFGTNFEVMEVIKKKAKQILETDKKLSKLIEKEARKHLSSSRLIRDVAKDIIKEKLERE